MKHLNRNIAFHLARAMQAVALLQFEGITIPPSCLAEYPFSTAVSIISVGVGLWLSAIAAALLRHHLPTALWRRIVYIGATGAVLLHPTIAASALKLLDCRTVQLSAASAARLDGASSAATTGSSSYSTSSAVVSVVVLESNPYIPCFGRTHAFAGGLAVATLVIYTAAMPALMLFWLWRDPWLVQELAQRRGKALVDSPSIKRRRSSVTPANGSSLSEAAPTVVSDLATQAYAATVDAPLLLHEPMLHPFLEGSNYTPEAWFWRHCDLVVVFGLSACNALLPTPQSLAEVRAF